MQMSFHMDRRAYIMLQDQYHMGLSAAALHASVLLCSAGTPIPWLSLGQQDVLLPANGSQTINLTYNADDMAAGTYRAQLCLFSDFSYGRQLSCVPTLHLDLDCMQKVNAQAATEQCTFPLDSTHFAIVIIIINITIVIVVVVIVIIIIIMLLFVSVIIMNAFCSRMSTCTRCLPVSFHLLFCAAEKVSERNTTNLAVLCL